VSNGQREASQSCLVVAVLSTPPRATQTITDDGKRQACEQVLAKQGYAVMVWDRRLAVPFAETERFLQWLGAQRLAVRTSGR